MLTERNVPAYASDFQEENSEFVILQDAQLKKYKTRQNKTLHKRQEMDKATLTFTAPEESGSCLWGWAVVCKTYNSLTALSALDVHKTGN